jgi:phosphatidate phosphatase APP1
MLPAGDERSFSGRIQIVPHDGVSVISDIDDTLKVSEVADRGRLLKNTFLHPFVPVPGMAELYRQWHAAGATFHYVSSSPWQLYRPLAELLRSEGFPDGSFHLRSSQFRDPSLLRLLVSRKRNKYRIIRAILRVLPQRRFILVGDSGEKDPEIYGLIARKFPAQIERILIRRVSGRSWTKKRCRQVFRDVPCDRWQTFRDPRQIRGVLELVSRTPA